MSSGSTPGPVARALAGFIVRAALAAVISVIGSSRAAEPRPDSTGKSFLWKVSSPTTTVYLLGSIHFARSDLYPLPDRIEQAFKSSTFLVVEANLNQAQAAAGLLEVAGKAFYPPDDNLLKHLTTPAAEQTAAKLAEYHLSLTNFTTFKPWFLAFNVVAIELKKLRITPENGIDLHFLQQAGHKKVLELESVKEQVEMLDGFSDQEQEMFLLSSLKDLKTLGEHMDEMVQAWRAGDATRLAAFLMKFASEEPALEPVYKKLLYDRNVRMVTKVQQYLQSRETHFVVVGAAHLVGNKGVLDLLKQKGFRLEQL